MVIALLMASPWLFNIPSTSVAGSLLSATNITASHFTLLHLLPPAPVDIDASTDKSSHDDKDPGTFKITVG